MSDSSDSEEELPCLLVGDGEQEEEGEEGEEMYVDSLGRATDLFSTKTFPTAEECMEHCRWVSSNPSQGGQYLRITPLEEGVAPARPGNVRGPTLCGATLTFS